jgi:DNA-binding GntR family transcriptional regulator
MAQIGKFPTRTAAVIDRIREDIVALRLAPGTVIRDNELAERYGVSSSPIREALTQMSAERLVEILPNRTKFVTPIDRRTVADFLEVHRILVRAGFAMGAAKVDAPRIAAMKAALDTMQELAQEGDATSFVKAARDFLDPVYKACGNAELRRQVALHATWLRRMMAMLPTDFFNATVRSYGQLLEYFERGDAEGACNYHDLILKRLEDLVLDLDLPEQGAADPDNRV